MNEKNIAKWDSLVIEFDNVLAWLDLGKILKENCFEYNDKSYILKGFYSDKIIESFVESISNDDLFFEKHFPTINFRGFRVVSYQVEMMSPWTKSGNPELVYLEAEVRLDVE